MNRSRNGTGRQYARSLFELLCACTAARRKRARETVSFRIVFGIIARRSPSQAPSASASGVELHPEQQLRKEKSSSEGHSGTDHRHPRLSENPVSTGVQWVVLLLPS